MIFGLGAAVRELQRVGRQLERPMQRAPRPADADAPARAAGRGARPQAAAPARRPPDQRPEPILPPDNAASEVDRQRSLLSPGTRSAGEPPVVDEGDLVPLSPAGHGRPAQRPQPATRATSRLETARAPEQPRPARNMFDPVWPAERAQPAEGSARQPSIDSPAPAESTPLPPPADQGQAQPTPVAILKSGVIDGMGYTLYTDGSIEAQLPEGVVRFESIEDLRLHLENNG
jgi:hypothetical protein